MKRKKTRLNNIKKKRTREIESHIGADTLPMAMLFVHTVIQKEHTAFLAYTLGDLSTNNTESKRVEREGKRD